MTSSRVQEVTAELRGLFTGPRTIGDAAVPPLIFVIVDALAGLLAASLAALATALLFVVWRVAKGRPLIYALGGIAGVGVAVGFALRTGSSEGFFLPGIITSAAYAVAAVVSVIVRRPLLAWASWLFRGWPIGWYWRRDVRPAYTETTLVWAAMWAVKAAIQYALYLDGRTELLATSKVIFSWPTLGPLLIGTYVYGNWRLHRLGGPSVEEFRAGAQPPFEGKQRGF